MENITPFETIYLEEIYHFPPPVTIMLDTSFEDIRPEHRDLLNKILHAVGHSMESVRILQQAKFDVSGWTEKPARLIAFIAPPNGVNQYEVIETQGMSVVFSDPLEKIAGDEPVKRKFWGALRQLFPS